MRISRVGRSKLTQQIKSIFKRNKVRMCMSIDDTLLRDVTLSQFTDALIRGNGFGNESIWMKHFFDGPFSIVENGVSGYTHNIAQNVMSEFFEKELGYSKEKETYFDEGGETAVTFESIEVSPDVYKKIYKNAFVIYAREGKRICISINKFGNREITYRLYSDPGETSLLMDWLNYAKKHNIYRNKKITADCKFLELAQASWDDIILNAKTIDVVKEHVSEMFNYGEHLRANKINMKRGVILAGPPGTGKTMLCKVLAKEMTGTVIYAMPSHMERTVDVRRICEMAKDLAPALLVIEDIDYIAENRDETQKAGMVIELMNHMDGIEEFSDIVTLATTNAQDKIEAAVKNRPGRFDRVVQIPIPNAGLRAKMLKRFTSNFHCVLDYENLVTATKGLSGAHIKHICESAAFKAIRAKEVDENKIALIQNKHFEEALKEINNEAFSSFHKARNIQRKIGLDSREDD